jgi:hypothetical protein
MKGIDRRGMGEYVIHKWAASFPGVIGFGSEMYSSGLLWQFLKTSQEKINAEFRTKDRGLNLGSVTLKL